MIKKIEEIGSALANLEGMVKTLKTERDSAKDAGESLKKQLDERELELLQLDEEIQNMTKRHEEEIKALKEEQQKLEEKLDSFAKRIREMIPMLSGSEDVQKGISSDKRGRA